MANIRVNTNRNGDKHYLVRIRMGGEIITRTFHKRSDAQRWARQTEADIAAGTYENPVAKKAAEEAARLKAENKKTLAVAIDRYTLQILPEKSERTAFSQKLQLEIWQKRIGHLLLESITPSVIVEHRDALMMERSFSGATANRYVRTLSHVLTMCSTDWEWLEANPARKVTAKKEPRGRVRYLSKKELPMLFQACRESDAPELYLIVLLALSTGARKGEIMNLRWNNVDLKRGFAYLLETKNGESRTIAITGEALELLRKHSKVRRLDSDLLFPSPNDAQRPLHFRASWLTALKRAQINDFRFHDLRHCAASYLAMSGASLAEIAEILGHRTLAMVKRYAHLSQDHVAGVVERMNREWLA